MTNPLRECVFVILEADPMVDCIMGDDLESMKIYTKLPCRQYDEPHEKWYHRITGRYQNVYVGGLSCDTVIKLRQLGIELVSIDVDFRENQFKLKLVGDAT